MSLHDSIRTIREIKQWTQEEMAEKLDMSLNAYSKIERGKTKLNFDKLEQIAQIFQINVAELIESKEKGFVCLFSENSQNNSNYYSGNEVVALENQKLKLELQYKDEIIERLRSENEALKELVALLKEKV